jgi:hypothetical protein
MKLKNPYTLSVTNPYVWILVIAHLVTCFALFQPMFQAKESVFVIFLCTVICALFAGMIKYLASVYALRTANRMVASLAKSVEFDEALNAEYILYLRPHWFDGRQGYINPSYRENPMHLGFWLHQRRVSLDLFLSLELEKVIVALGTREMQLATGSIQVKDEVWERTVSKLIDRATQIVFIPDVTTGLTFELLEIGRQGLYDKVVLVQPPELAVSSPDDCEQRSLQKTWSSVKEHWPDVQNYIKNNFGLTIADFQEVGMAVPLSDAPRLSTRQLAADLRKPLERLSKVTKSDMTSPIRDHAHPAEKKAFEGKAYWVVGVIGTMALLTTLFQVRAEASKARKLLVEVQAAEAKGASVNYDWQWDGIPIPGQGIKARTKSTPFKSTVRKLSGNPAFFAQVAMISIDFTKSDFKDEDVPLLKSFEGATIFVTELEYPTDARRKFFKDQLPGCNVKFISKSPFRLHR